MTQFDDILPCTAFRESAPDGAFFRLLFLLGRFPHICCITELRFMKCL